MLKENKKTLEQIDRYIKNHMTTMSSRGFGKTGMMINIMQINFGLELYKDVIKNATEYISFEQVLKMVVDALHQAYKDSDEDEYNEI